MKMGLKMSTRFTYLLLLKLPRNTTNNAVWLSSLHEVVFVSANRHKENKRMKVREDFREKLIEFVALFKAETHIRWKKGG